MTGEQRVLEDRPEMSEQLFTWHRLVWHVEPDRLPHSLGNEGRRNDTLVRQRAEEVRPERDDVVREFTGLIRAPVELGEGRRSLGHGGA